MRQQVKGNAQVSHVFLLAIEYNVAQNVGVQISLPDPAFNFFGYILRVELLEHMVILPDAGKD